MASPHSAHSVAVARRSKRQPAWFSPFYTKSILIRSHDCETICPFSSFFSPIGFLWCTHVSYRITLDFLLPMPVLSGQHPTPNGHKDCPGNLNHYSFFKRFIHVILNSHILSMQIIHKPSNRILQRIQHFGINSNIRFPPPARNCPCTFFQS